MADFAQSPVGTAVVRILAAGGADPSVRALAATAYGDAGGRRPWTVLARAAERGELRRDVDPSLLLFTIAGAIVHRVLVEQQPVTDAFLGPLVDLVLRGAAPPSTPPTTLTTAPGKRVLRGR